jgi:hypothetical protein
MGRSTSGGRVFVEGEGKPGVGESGDVYWCGGCKEVTQEAQGRVLDVGERSFLLLTF